MKVSFWGVALLTSLIMLGSSVYADEAKPKQESDGVLVPVTPESIKRLREEKKQKLDAQKAKEDGRSSRTGKKGQDGQERTQDRTCLQILAGQEPVTSESISEPRPPGPGATFCPGPPANTKRRPAGRLEVKVRLSLYEGRFLSRAEGSNRPVLTQFSKSSRSPWAE